MPIKQLKKEFEERKERWLVMLDNNDVFNHKGEISSEANVVFEEIEEFIEKRIIPEIIKEMLVEERSSGLSVFNYKSKKDSDERKGFNQCCAIGREKAEKLKGEPEITPENLGDCI